MCVYITSSLDVGSVLVCDGAKLSAGSARTVNRRYIAIFVAYKDRTWASALFVSLSAVGMALGPLLALPLSHFPTLKFAGLTFDHVSSLPAMNFCPYLMIQLRIV